MTRMSPCALGKESTVTLTFSKQKSGTRMKLVHTGLPNTKEGQGHNGGWNFFMDFFKTEFGKRARK